MGRRAVCNGVLVAGLLDLLELEALSVGLRISVDGVASFEQGRREMRMLGQHISHMLSELCSWAHVGAPCHMKFSL